MKKILFFMSLLFIYAGSCFANKTKDTVITGIGAFGSTEVIPSISQNPFIDFFGKLIIGIISAVFTQFLKDIIISKKKKNNPVKFIE